MRSQIGSLTLALINSNVKLNTRGHQGQDVAATGKNADHESWQQSSPQLLQPRSPLVLQIYGCHAVVVSVGLIPLAEGEF